MVILFNVWFIPDSGLFSLERFHRNINIFPFEFDTFI